jgi:uncharacterized protein (TIGR00661 family)
MNILYGVQTTGNGHISRSREVIEQLKHLGHDVHVILSGSDPYRLSEVKIIKPATVFRGLTFFTYRGKIQYLKTAVNLNLFRFYRDIRSFDAGTYDLVINDFEPISARIAGRHNIPSIGIGHQYAFCYDIPLEGDTFISRWIIKNFGPTDHPIGLHWHHFNQPILPPIVPAQLDPTQPAVKNKILVYLPFEHLRDILDVFDPIKEWEFFIYGPVEREENYDHLHLRTYSRSGFLSDLEESEGVVCNAGFELASEALQIGKKLLVKPVLGQMEQSSNALVIGQLKLGHVMSKLDTMKVVRWLDSSPTRSMGYPNVARLIAEWVDRGHWEDIRGLAQEAWGDLKNKNFDVTFNIKS